MAVISHTEEVGPVLHVSFENGQVISTENIGPFTQDLLNKDFSALEKNTFALDWLWLQFQASLQSITPLELISKAHAPAVQTTSYIGQLCPLTQKYIDKALTDLCLIDVTSDTTGMMVKNLRLGRGRYLRLRMIGIWQKDQITDFLIALKGLPIDCVELPFQTYDTSFQKSCLIALAIRPEPHKIEDVLKDKPTQRIHLDPVLLNGVQKTFEIAVQAKARLIDPIITAPALSPVGMRACVSLARAIDLQGHFAHDLDQIKPAESVPALHMQAGWFID